MMKKTTVLALFGAMALALPMSASAAELYEQCISDWGSNVKNIEGREFKFLADPAKTKADPKAAFKDIWTQATAVLEKNGLKVEERKKKAWSLTPTVKTFFDTPNMDLWKKGYLIRTTTQYKDVYPQSPMKVVVKRINSPFKTIMNAKLATADGKGKAVAEDNIGYGPNKKPFSYVEKSVGFMAGRAELGEMNLADFAAYVPELKKLGLKPDTKLVAYPAFGIRCRPGTVEIPGLDRPTSVSMESWARTPGGTPFVYDFSFGYEGDFKAMKEAHKNAEKAMAAVYKELSDKLALPNSEQYIGSKVRVLLNQPYKAK